MEGLILNKGMMKTYHAENLDGQPKVFNNELIWNADYDGKLANLSVDINKNGRKKHLDMKLTNKDLSKLLSIPSVDRSLDKRLMNDFLIDKERKQIPVSISQIEEPIRLPKHKTIKNKIKKSKSTKSSKSSKSSKSTKSFKKTKRTIPLYPE